MAAPFAWFDLTTSGDGDGVRDFYTQLFDWTIGPNMDRIPDGLVVADALKS